MQIYMVLIAYSILLLIEFPAFYGGELLDKFRYLQLELSYRSSIGAMICCQRRSYDSCAPKCKVLCLSSTLLVDEIARELDVDAYDKQGPVYSLSYPQLSGQKRQ